MATKKHVFMYVYPAFGHIIPMLNLAKKISSVHLTTFAVSKVKLEALRNRGLVTAGVESTIKFMGVEDGLTEEDDKDVGPAGMARNGPMAAEGVGSVIKNLSVASAAISAGTRSPYDVVDVAIVDLAAAGAIPYFDDAGLPFILFNSAAAGLLPHYLQMDANTPTVSDENFFLSPDQQTGWGVPESFQIIRDKYSHTWGRARSFILNTITEIEGDTIAKLKTLDAAVGKTVRAVAPLFLDGDPEIARECAQLPLIANWLNQQENQCVIYFSFGSMAVSSAEQIGEIAKALYALKKPFIWSLREADQKSLPADIFDRISYQFEAPFQFLILDWAPQKMILEHRATKVFVSHCGWNSSLESLTYGIPVVAWPMFGDQHENAPLLERLGTALLIPGTNMRYTRIVSADEISQAILKVGGWNATGAKEDYWEKALEMRQYIATAAARGGSSHTAMQNFLLIDL